MEIRFNIRPPETIAEIQEGQNLLSSLFKKAYGTFPQEIPDQLLYAFSVPENKVVATIGLELKSTRQKLEVEKYFDFDINKVYPNVPPQKIGEIERLTSVNRYITPYLVSAILKFAMNIGVDYIATFNKKMVAKVFEKVYKLKFQSFEPIPYKKTLESEYKEYFNKKDLIIFTQKTDILYDILINNFDFDTPLIKFDIPKQIQMPKK